MIDEPTQNALRQLLDKEGIRDLARRYADCVWRRDAAGAVELFASDGVMDTGERPPIAGRVALLESYQSMITGPDLQPFVHNHVIELRGDAASGRCYLDLRATMGGKSMIGSGHYEDEYVRVDGAWKFRSRKLVMKFLVPIQKGWSG
jgi:hypothetical protein